MFGPGSLVKELQKLLIWSFRRVVLKKKKLMRVAVAPCQQKHLVDESGQMKLAKLVQAYRKPTFTQITKQLW